MIRSVTTIGLIIVGACAVAVSFAGLYGLALLCRFDWRLAALVPVLVDAGAGVATVAWLAGDVPPAARRYARRLALGLLGASVAGNATAHLLATLEVDPPWWVVVLVGALAPAVLAAVIHLSALVRAGGDDSSNAGEEEGEPVLIGMPGFRFTERVHVEVSAPAEVLPPDASEVAPGGASEDEERPVRLALAGTADDSECRDDEADTLAKAREMAAAGVGRPTLVKELGLKDHVAREIVRAHRPRQEAGG